MGATFPEVAFILLDASMNPIWFNAAGIEILSYPEKADPGRVKVLLARKVPSLGPNAQTSEDGPAAIEFTSGNRRCICRTFVLKSWGRGAGSRAIGLLLERTSESAGVSLLAEEFKLTPRQRGVVELLTEGLTNKEIATRLRISSNTVKAHIRLMMIKTQVTTRSGLLGKIIAPGPPPGRSPPTERRRDFGAG